jgi:hypothetical protein
LRSWRGWNSTEQWTAIQNAALKDYIERESGADDAETSNSWFSSLLNRGDGNSKHESAFMKAVTWMEITRKWSVNSNLSGYEQGRLLSLKLDSRTWENSEEQISARWDSNSRIE